MAFTYAIYLFFTLFGAFAFKQLFSISFSTKQKKAIVLSLIATTILFSFWDAWAVSRGHWLFNPETVMGIWLGNQPLEEILFFVSIPFLGIVLYEIFSKREARK